MSFIQETIECNKCKYQMNVSTGTFGTGIPKACPNCETLLEYKVISGGWNANPMDNKEQKQIEEILKEVDEEWNFVEIDYSGADKDKAPVIVPMDDVVKRLINKAYSLGIQLGKEETLAKDRLEIGSY